MARFQGDGNANVLNGTSGSDVILGGNGSDTLSGGFGNDAIYGYGAGTAPAGTAIAATRIATDFANPLGMVQAPGGRNRSFVLEQHSGLIKIIDLDSGTVSGTPFLDIGNLTSKGNEQGLLGLAFHPLFAQNGKFYVNYTDVSGDTQIVEYGVSASDPNRADPGSARLILTVDHTNGFHNAGWMGFGQDNLLYIATGDDQNAARAQNINDLHGKILRIDVNGSTSGLPYGIPAGNPFSGVDGADEIWAYGLRNPWRGSFDMLAGSLWIGDVGESTREEIDFQPAGVSGGQNFGWSIMEGTQVFTPGVSTGGLTTPIYDYGRSVGTSVTGGYVYQGAAAGFAGQYVFGDFLSGGIWTLLEENGRAVSVVERTPAIQASAGTVDFIASFSQDKDGNIYVISLGGSIFRLDFPIDTADAANSLDGGIGNDRLFGGSGGDTLTGGVGNDNLLANGGNDILRAILSDGNDTLSGGDGIDTLDYSAVQWTVTVNLLAGTTAGSAGEDILSDIFERVIGTSASDVLAGSNLAEELIGAGNGDRIYGNRGNDTMRGGDGDDAVYFSVNDGNDQIEGGTGLDTLDYSALTGGVQVNLLAGTTNGTANNDTLLDRFERVVGSQIGDVLAGSHSNDVLSGGGGADQIFGNNGDDTLAGGDGNDTLTLGFGNDILSFRLGDDTDTVLDFVAGSGSFDVIDLVGYSGISSFAQLQNEARLVTIGGHSEIVLSGSDRIILSNVASHTLLNSSDFRF